MKELLHNEKCAINLAGKFKVFYERINSQQKCCCFMKILILDYLSGSVQSHLYFIGSVRVNQTLFLAQTSTLYLVIIMIIDSNIRYNHKLQKEHVGSGKWLFFQNTKFVTYTFLMYKLRVVIFFG